MIEIMLGGRNIPRAQRKIAVIDDEDADLASFGWSVSGSAAARSSLPDEFGKRKKIFLHIEVAKRIGLDTEKFKIGRKNGDALDARRSNLAEMTASMIACATKPKSASGFKGVSSRRGKWYAMIEVSGKVTFLGDHKTAEEAARAYDAAAREHFGDLAYQNFPLGLESKSVVERTPLPEAKPDDVVKIQLGGKRGVGWVALIDGIDSDLADSKWHLRRSGKDKDGGIIGYAARTLHENPDDSNDTYAELLHVIVAKRMGLDLEGRDVDHKDRNKMNCRRSNLRAATRSQNKANSGYRIGPSGFRGVVKRGKRYEARIKCVQETEYLGGYATAEEAARVYDEAAVRLFGEFATLNFPQEQPCLS